MQAAHLWGRQAGSRLWTQILWVWQPSHVCEGRKIAGPPLPLQHLQQTSTYFRADSCGDSSLYSTLTSLRLPQGLARERQAWPATDPDLACKDRRRGKCRGPRLTSRNLSASITRHAHASSRELHTCTREGAVAQVQRSLAAVGGQGCRCLARGIWLPAL